MAPTSSRFIKERLAMSGTSAPAAAEATVRLTAATRTAGARRTAASGLALQPNFTWLDIASAMELGWRRRM